MNGIAIVNTHRLLLKGNETLIEHRMGIFKRTMRAFRIFLFAFMLAICIVLGIAPIIPRRKGEFDNEVKMEDDKNMDNENGHIVFEQVDN